MRKRVRQRLFAIVGVGLSVTVCALALLQARARHRRNEPARCQAGPTTPGIDVSYYQETIDWPRVRRAGIRFAFIRVSDGALQRDARFATNWAEAKRAGVVRGAYQFFRPDQSVNAQADLMIAAMAGRDAADLPPVIDIEIDGGLDLSTVAERAAAWIDRVRQRLGVEPIVYTGSDLWRNGGAEALEPQSLWLAHYTPGCPTVPPPWRRWTFWQHTDRGAVPGIIGPVDLDLFAGELGELTAAR
ncbi:MAG TPA: GH25 family lysozyme [Kofleriaceae bacterium]|nr:GH25 family lysozyme [Kofleriaceae bacterium]